MSCCKFVRICALVSPPPVYLHEKVWSPAGHTEASFALDKNDDTEWIAHCSPCEALEGELIVEVQKSVGWPKVDLLTMIPG